jgi:hypothetical protein
MIGWLDFAASFDSLYFLRQKVSNLPHIAGMENSIP